MGAQIIDVEIKIRHAEPDDYLALQRVFLSPNAVFGTLGIPFVPAERFRKRVEDPKDGSYILVACVDDEVIGCLGILTHPEAPRRRHAADLGMAVRDDFQGKGVGTELVKAAVELADKWLNLQRLELSVYVDNEPAIRLYKRFGFEVEGILRRYAFRNGGYVDAYGMARLASDHKEK